MSAGRVKSAAEEMELARLTLEDAALILPLSPRVAAREAYLAMLHAAHARIAATGRHVPSTHKGVSILMGELYRGAPFRAQEELAECELWKFAADYGRSNAATPMEASAAIEQARRFVTRMRADIDPAELQLRMDAESIAALKSLPPDEDA